LPKRYHVKIRAAPPRFRRIGKYGIVDRREDCSACRNCVKRECLYDCYTEEDDRLRKVEGYLDYLYQCKSCLSCVQSCTKGLLSRKVNPEFEALGNGSWTPQIISTTWYQAETGKIPVSGAGYGGPFTGHGFDAIWTDMSEIVRPTRDGIHGREYISTSVDIGRMMPRLSFNEEGELAEPPLPLLEIPLPLIFDLVPLREVPVSARKASASAAQELGNFAVVRCGEMDESFEQFGAAVVPLFDGEVEGESGRIEHARMVELEDAQDVLQKVSAIKEINPAAAAAIRVKLDRRSAERVVRLTEEGAEVIHLYADRDGQEWEKGDRRHISSVTREVHLALVEARMRDEVTLIASGGIGLAEHMAKEIICGADLVGIDVPLPIALECRVCQRCNRGLSCPVEMERVDIGYARQRIVNLVGAWRSQLIEVLGAMGIREVRRLRGEVGRAMFFEELERESFGPIFGRRKAEKEASAAV
jgi:ferredoxin